MKKTVALQSVISYDYNYVFCSFKRASFFQEGRNVKHSFFSWINGGFKMIDSLGQQSLFNILISLMVLTVVWWSVQSFKFELFLTNPNGAKAKALMVIITIALTHLVTSFLLSYLNWSTMLRHLF